MKENIISFSSVLIFLGLILSCQTGVEKIEGSIETEDRRENDFKVIAYYTPSTGKIDDEKLQKLDQVIYSFLHLEENRLSINSKKDSLAINYLVTLKKMNPSLEVLISLGGWGGCETCSEVFSSEKGRKDFAISVKDILEEYGADGIDLDWEYPAVKGFPGHPYKPEDKQNFTALVMQLRQTLGDNKIISFAAPGFEDFIQNGIEWEEVMPLVDHLNLMSYDMVHGGSNLTGHHSALFSSRDQNMSADYSIRYLDSLGVPKDKIVIGGAFYARVWENVDSANNGLFQQGKFKEAILYKDLDIFQEDNPGFTRHYDSIAQAPFLYNPGKGLFVTYDDSTSIAKKTEYALENGLKGIMFWQLSGDRNGSGLVDVIEQKVKEKMKSHN